MGGIELQRPRIVGDRPRLVATVHISLAKTIIYIARFWIGVDIQLEHQNRVSDAARTDELIAKIVQFAFAETVMVLRYNLKPLILFRSSQNTLMRDREG